MTHWQRFAVFGIHRVLPEGLVRGEALVARAIVPSVPAHRRERRGRRRRRRRRRRRTAAAGISLSFDGNARRRDDPLITFAREHDADVDGSAAKAVLAVSGATAREAAEVLVPVLLVVSLVLRASYRSEVNLLREI